MFSYVRASCILISLLYRSSILYDNLTFHCQSACFGTFPPATNKGMPWMVLPQGIGTGKVPASRQCMSSFNMMCCSLPWGLCKAKTFQQPIANWYKLYQKNLKSCRVDKLRLILHGLHQLQIQRIHQIPPSVQMQNSSQLSISTAVQKWCLAPLR